MLHTPSEHIGSVVPLYGAGDAGTSGGGGQTQDHQAPKIIVGNQTEGDSAFVCNVLDTGNGAGLAIAIFQASVEGSDIWVRPGAIDFNLPGAPALPLTIPGNCTVRGASVNEVLLIPPSVGNAQLFILDDGAILERMAFLVRGINGGTQAALVETTGAARFNTLAFQFDVVPDTATGALTTCIASTALAGNNLTFVRLRDVQMVFADGSGPGDGVGFAVPTSLDENSVVVVAEDVFMANVARGWDMQGSAVLFGVQCFVINANDAAVNFQSPFGDLLQLNQCVFILDSRASGAVGARIVDGQASFHQCLFGGDDTTGGTHIECSSSPLNGGGNVQVVGCALNGGSRMTYGVRVIAGANTPTLTMTGSTVQGPYVAALQLEGGSRHTIVGNDLAVYQPLGPANVIVDRSNFARIEGNNILFFPDAASTDQVVQLVGGNGVFSGNVISGYGGGFVVAYGNDYIISGNHVDVYSSVFEYCIQTAANVQRTVIEGNRVSCQGRINAPAIYLYGADHTCSGNLLFVNDATGVILNAQTSIALGNRVVGRNANPPVDDQQGTSDVAHNF